MSGSISKTKSKSVKHKLTARTTSTLPPLLYNDITCEWILFCIAPVLCYNFFKSTRHSQSFGQWVSG
ncbi:hypothetical protein Bpfe_020544 [Biomphalaria pfeifferi]|uniref:Uncharacterized protein n=1 Tax=Biomphalaria pfeifferi TaxID=112525 RepID=A0AAD8B8J5_BIOPF|nr:hypothetical protein Bpfe_020544 [Biomphalaria pfeifferi]